MRTGSASLFEVDMATCSAASARRRMVSRLVRTSQAQGASESAVPTRTGVRTTCQTKAVETEDDFTFRGIPIPCPG